MEALWEEFRRIHVEEESLGEDPFLRLIVARSTLKHMHRRGNDGGSWNPRAWKEFKWRMKRHS